MSDERGYLPRVYRDVRAEHPGIARGYTVDTRESDDSAAGE
jgi:hypothetical protein